MLHYFFFAVIFIGLVILSRRRQIPPGSKWPPGPLGLPIIGRVWDIPRVHAFRRFTSWAEQYGPIYSVSIMGNNHVFVASDAIAHDLLSKRGLKYSSRLPIGQIEGVGPVRPQYLPFHKYNDGWRRQRKLVKQLLQASLKVNFLQIPRLEVGNLLISMVERPDNHHKSVLGYTENVISRLAFGDTSPASECTDQAHALLRTISQDDMLSNAIPQLAYLPEFLSPWKRAERQRRSSERRFFTKMKDAFAEKVAAGRAESSFIRTAFELENKDEFNDEEISDIVSLVAVIGSFATSSVIMTFLLAMVLFPEWGKKLQEEVDYVCGRSMPRLSDSPNLPVLRAVIMEVLRWKPVVTGGVPHASTEDDIYDGYFIPKGSYIHPIHWAILRDPKMYPEPESFNPDRWLNPNYPSYREPLSKFPDLHNFTPFGYGRRMCVGMDIVEHELFYAISGIVWAGTVSRRKDGDGKEIVPDGLKFTKYLVSWPEAFQFDFKPRCEKRWAEILLLRDQANQG